MDDILVTSDNATYNDELFVAVENEIANIEILVHYTSFLVLSSQLKYIIELLQCKNMNQDSNISSHGRLDPLEAFLELCNMLLSHMLSTIPTKLCMHQLNNIEKI